LLSLTCFSQSEVSLVEEYKRLESSVFVLTNRQATVQWTGHISKSLADTTPRSCSLRRHQEDVYGDDRGHSRVCDSRWRDRFGRLRCHLSVGEYPWRIYYHKYYFSSLFLGAMPAILGR